MINRIRSPNKMQLLHTIYCSLHLLQFRQGFLNTGHITTKKYIILNIKNLFIVVKTLKEVFLPHY